MPNLGATELIIIAVIVILLFGAKKLPDAARSLGRSMRIFKSEVKEMQNDDQPQLPQGQTYQQNMAQPQQFQQPMQQPVQQPQQYQQDVNYQNPNQQYPPNPAQ